MQFDFVDIGTSDFDTSASLALPNQKILLIEPIKEYLDALPVGENIFKENYAVGIETGSMEIFYVTPANIKELNLPAWVRGSNSIGRPHPIVKDLLESLNIDLDIIKKEIVNIVPLSFFIEKYNIDSITNLKIDTEGYDHHIVDQVYNLVKTGFKINEIKFEYNPVFNNTTILDSLAAGFVSYGYKQRWSKKKRDIILTK